VKITKLKLNESNPRTITDAKFKQLLASVQDFPRMMALRPITVDENFVILGGNMRYRACVELGYKELPDEWVQQVKDLTEEEKRRFVIEDNVQFGQWDYDTLANEWDVSQLTEWGLPVNEYMQSDAGAPQDTDWAKVFEDSGDTSLHDGMKGITFVLRSEYIEKLKKVLVKYDKNKDEALMKLVDEICG
jgi:hypothetical protein